MEIADYYKFHTVYKFHTEHKFHKCELEIAFPYFVSGGAVIVNV